MGDCLFASSYVSCGIIVNNRPFTHPLSFSGVDAHSTLVIVRTPVQHLPLQLTEPSTEVTSLSNVNDAVALVQSEDPASFRHPTVIALLAGHGVAHVDSTSSVRFQRFSPRGSVVTELGRSNLHWRIGSLDRRRVDPLRQKSRVPDRPARRGRTLILCRNR